MERFDRLIEGVELPLMLRVRQRFDRGFIAPEDIPPLIAGQMSSSGLDGCIRPGMRVALTAGSREICNMDVIFASVAAHLQALGAEPFIVPAMGSHGGAEAEGQRQILAGYNITEERCGCPVVSSMETARIGSTADGQDVFIDRNAAQADGILVINRVKAHTGFRGKYESGIMKMMAVGLGKQKGAEICHSRGFGHMAESVEQFGLAVLENAPVLGAVAILENAVDQTAQITVLRREEIARREPELLLKAKSLMARILLDECDVLIVDEIGKNFSGAGMDPNVTGLPSPYCEGSMDCQRVVVLRMSEKTHNNGYGVGLADCTTRDLCRALDLEAMYINGITSMSMEACRIPCIFDSEKLAIQGAVRMCQDIGPTGPRIIRIANTMEVEEIMVSANLAQEAARHPQMEVIGEPFPLAFDDRGTLIN